MIREDCKSIAPHAPFFTRNALSSTVVKRW
jgi:hypothetical protein